jgi:hypothetical protein
MKKKMFCRCGHLLEEHDLEHNMCLMMVDPDYSEERWHCECEVFTPLMQIGLLRKP